MSGPFKMKGSPMKRNFGIGVSPAKQAPIVTTEVVQEEPTEFKGRSSDVIATEGKFKGQKVDPRTGMPKGYSAPPSESEIKNKDKIAELRSKYDAAEPFSDEQEAIRQQILKLRGK